jgi:hypothetical protein
MARRRYGLVTALGITRSKWPPEQRLEPFLQAEIGVGPLARPQFGELDEEIDVARGRVERAGRGGPEELETPNAEAPA